MSQTMYASQRGRMPKWFQATNKWNMNISVRLKICPFCGHPQQFSWQIAIHTWQLPIYAYCHTCQDEECLEDHLTPNGRTCTSRGDQYTIAALACTRGKHQNSYGSQQLVVVSPALANLARRRTSCQNKDNETIRVELLGPEMLVLGWIVLLKSTTAPPCNFKALNHSQKCVLHTGKKVHKYKPK